MWFSPQPPRTFDPTSPSYTYLLPRNKIGNPSASLFALGDPAGSRRRPSPLAMDLVWHFTKLLSSPARNTGASPKTQNCCDSGSTTNLGLVPADFLLVPCGSWFPTLASRFHRAWSIHEMSSSTPTSRRASCNVCIRSRKALVQWAC